MKALRPFVDKRDGDKERFINDEYLFKGPGTYEPRIDEEIKKKIEAIVVLPNNALLQGPDYVYTVETLNSIKISDAAFGGGDILVTVIG